MSATAPGSVGELVSRMREGMVPHNVRLFAAQGLLPVGREELIRLLVFLVADGDSEIGSAARATLDTFTTDNFMSVLQEEDVDPVDIDLLTRAVKDEAVWQAIVRHPKVADETLRWLARVAPAKTQDAIITNQRRILSCLEILNDLRENPQVTQEVMRRAREFEEEFLEKALTWATAGEAAPELDAGTSIEQALAALKAIGVQLAGPDISRDVPTPEEDDSKHGVSGDAYVRIALMNTHQRVIAALVGTREERLILARDRSQLIVRAVMSSPKMNEADIEHIAGMRSVNEECLRIIGMKGRWLRRYGVVHNLAFNPRTPVNLAMQMLNRLSVRDLALLGRDRNVSSVIRRMASERFKQRQ
ncbi:MAG: hypothetical protein H6Q02_1334 [Acidobacteria bacterium]|nr:hypothetical protein [Acidobacteriota bacterium]